MKLVRYLVKGDMGVISIYKLLFHLHNSIHLFIYNQTHVLLRQILFDLLNTNLIFLDFLACIGYP